MSRSKQRQRSEARIASRAAFLTSSKDGRSKGGEATTTHKTGTIDEWLAARLQLLEAEKGYSRRGDEPAQRRQELPWVPIEEPYRSETHDGRALLADLFRGRSQLLVYHVMFGLDRAPKGRNETGPWWHRHDEYAELKAGHSDDLGTGGCSLG